MADGGRVTVGTVSVGASATLIRAARTSRDAVIIQNVHASQVLYLGDSAVTTSTGLKVAAGESIQLPTCGDVYGIASGAATDVRYFEAY